MAAFSESPMYIMSSESITSPTGLFNKATSEVPSDNLIFEGFLQR